VRWQACGDACSWCWLWVGDWVWVCLSRSIGAVWRPPERKLRQRVMRAGFASARPRLRGRPERKLVSVAGAARAKLASTYAITAPAAPESSC
jgi:hypothetical protein